MMSGLVQQGTWAWHHDCSTDFRNALALNSLKNSGRGSKWPTVGPTYIYIYATSPASDLIDKKGKEQYTALRFNSRQLRHLRKNCHMNAEPPAKAFETNETTAQPLVIIATSSGSIVLLSHSLSMTSPVVTSCCNLSSLLPS